VLNGVQFDGRTLRVSKEKTNIGSSSGGGGGGFGSSRWAGDDDRQQHNHHHRRNKNQQTTPSAQTNVNNVLPVAQFTRRGDDDEESVTTQVKTTISNEIKGSEDEVNAAIACTAAMTLLSSIDAFGLEDHIQPTYNEDNDDSAVSTTTSVPQDDELSTNEFKSRCTLPMSDLLAEYGEQDVHWKSNKPTNTKDDSNNAAPFKSRLEPLSNLLAEYSEQDAGWMKQQQQQQQQQQPDPSSSSNAKQTTSTKQSDKNADNGMLAHFDKAPIHLEIMSCKCSLLQKHCISYTSLSHAII
jgi:hypothetical protein